MYTIIGPETNLTLCLIGRFLTERQIHTQMMKERMAEVWHPRKGVSIREIDSGLFLFQFYHPLGLQRILKGGPWSFDRHLLILGIIKDGEVPNQIPLYTVPFWVQIHQLPPGFNSSSVGQNIANHIGEFLEFDSRNTTTFWRSYMRVRVLIDVRKPLKKSKRIKKPGGEATVVLFKYEKLGPFCFVCGLLGHMEDSCEFLFNASEDDGQRGWGPELRADPRTATPRSRWLRDEDSGFNSPQNLGYSGYYGIGQSVTFNAQSGNHIYPDNHDNKKRNDLMTEIFKNPAIMTARAHTSNATSNSHVQQNTTADIAKEPINLTHANQNSVAANDDLTILDRKRRYHDDATTTDEHTTTSIMDTEDADHFLWAGPGNQACQGS
uniref:Uncharacterized protein At4g02000 family n=2 Tax=Cajanus cajan TaxID=3821 RepID=A0A151RUL2_CAJCA|nr:Uncharacterized protein At4g02000 family [Cajanus cajan]